MLHNVLMRLFAILLAGLPLHAQGRRWVPPFHPATPARVELINRFHARIGLPSVFQASSSFDQALIGSLRVEPALEEALAAAVDSPAEVSAETRAAYEGVLRQAAHRVQPALRERVEDVMRRLGRKDAVISDGLSEAFLNTVADLKAFGFLGGPAASELAPVRELENSFRAARMAAVWAGAVKFLERRRGESGSGVGLPAGPGPGAERLKVIYNGERSSDGRKFFDLWLDGQRAGTAELIETPPAGEKSPGTVEVVQEPRYNKFVGDKRFYDDPQAPELFYRWAAERARAQGKLLKVKAFSPLGYLLARGNLDLERTNVALDGEKYLPEKLVNFEARAPGYLGIKKGETLKPERVRLRIPIVLIGPPTGE